jgi:hypothetical protein
MKPRESIPVEIFDFFTISGQETAADSRVKRAGAKTSMDGLHQSRGNPAFLERGFGILTEP